jgi:amino acid transporter
MVSRGSADGSQSLGTGRVVFLVIAAAAPLAAMVGNVPLAVIYGNGAGVPAAFVIAGLVLLCFSVGYAAMSRRVVNTGAFYTYIARSLGKPAGVSAAYVAVLSYGTLTFGLAGAFGYYTSLVLDGLGVTVSWWLLAAIGAAVVGVLGYRSVDISSKILGTLMVLEFLVLIAFNALVIADLGGAAFPAESFSRESFSLGALTDGSLGIALMFALFSFVGFESAALYGEETRDPERSIPRATYIAVASIGIFYVLTSWLIVGAAGAAQAKGMAEEAKGEFVFDLFQSYGGTNLYNVSAVLLCTSVLAGYLALHNATSRYLFALGREQVLPRHLGRYHPQHFSPHIASVVVSVLTVIVVGGFAIAGSDPFIVMVPSLIGVGTLGIIALQAAASLAVVAYFWTRNDRTWWSGVVAPGVGFFGLVIAFVMAITHYPTLTGSSDTLVNSVPLVLIGAGLAGLIAALVLRRRRPATYAAIARSKVRGRRHRSTKKVAYSRRYCLIGAGPAGLVMARALIAEGVPFDWFERHADVGGIWDIDNPGSPMYESAHFISSKYTSGFIGYPMPEDFPDYPSWRQIRDYIRAFARDFGLYDHVTLGVAVTHAQPLDTGARWRVTLSTGEIREYDGLLAAPGVTWHPNAPALAGAEDFTGEIRHSVTFRDGAELRDKRVLVVGAGNSGVDIACDAARNADRTFFSVRRGYRFIPKHIFGLPTDAVLSGAIDPPRGVSLSGDPGQLVDTLVGDLTRLGLPAPDHDLLTTHPIMNTQVLHYLQHGDLVAKPDVARLTAGGVAFVDGSEEQIDVVLLATGYDYLLPFLDREILTWRQGRPEFYLNLFSREHDSLYVLGLIEFAGAAYARFDEMAQTVLIDLRARETGVHRTELLELKHADRPDLTGGIAYVDSARHANYVHYDTYVNYLADLRDRFGWADLDAAAYDALRRPTGAAS